MDSLGKLGSVVLATAVFWAFAAIVIVAVNIQLVTTVAAIMGMLFTFVVWAQWAENQQKTSNTEARRAKAKRDTDDGDARLATLLALMTSDERDALRDRLVDDLSGDGEAVSLGDLLAEDEMGDLRAGRMR